MSSSSDSGLAAAVDRVTRCLSDGQLGSFFDWLLTIDDELKFVWRRGRITWTHVLFVFARYPALASAILSLLPPGIVQSQVKDGLRGVVMMAAEREYLSHHAVDTRPLSQPVIVMMRTWAIWGRSRRMLISLVAFFLACAIPGLVIVTVDISTSVPPSGIQIEGMGPCETPSGVVGRIWVLTYLFIMLFEAGMLVLTVYKTIPFRNSTSRQMRSKLLDMLWIDGVIYFVFMILIGFFNIGLHLQVSDPQLHKLRSAGGELQAVLHSVLSTRIVLHISTVLREGVIVSRL
ncbi:hypothetical protein BGW80DRAFT_1462445 [Lactifluus volemus]|nr:hypothetical protein BGW80DRAFT_1462445 [Lactifluus volemus]